MTARFSVKNSHIEHDLILVLKKQTPAVKEITVRLKFSTKYSVSRDNPEQNITSVSRDTPVQNIQSVGIFQYKIFSQ